MESYITESMERIIENGKGEPVWLNRHNAEAILAAVSPKWQPIETAPKDGTWVILGLSENWKLGVDGRSCPGYWLTGWEHGVDYEGRESGWEDVYHNDVEPICWMPLPSPPEAP